MGFTPPHSSGIEIDARFPHPPGHISVQFNRQSTLPRKARKRGKAAKRGLSHEQVLVLVARDRAGVTADCVIKSTDATTLAAALKPIVPTDIVLCTDGSSVLAAAAR